MGTPGPDWDGSTSMCFSLSGGQMGTPSPDWRGLGGPAPHLLRAELLAVSRLSSNSQRLRSDSASCLSGPARTSMFWQSVRF